MKYIVAAIATVAINHAVANDSRFLSLDDQGEVGDSLDQYLTDEWVWAYPIFDSDDSAVGGKENTKETEKESKDKNNESSNHKWKLFD